MDNIEVYHRSSKKILSNHFTVQDFICGCKAEYIFISKTLVEKLELIYSHYEFLYGEIDFVITSGYRDEIHNKEVGSTAKKSYHKAGVAADFHIKIKSNNKKINPGDIYKFCNTWHNGGLGYYDSFTHIDERGNKARWGT